MTIEALYNLFLENPIVCTDTRRIEPNSIFFALKGENFNGNKFSSDALQKGSSYVVIDEEAYKKDDRFILVNDVLETLQQLANYHRKQLNIPILGITGTNGKTTTKELANAILSKKFKVYATQGNLNNHIGVPLTLLAMTKDVEIGVVEMGANHLGEISELCKIVEPNYGIITNVGKAHLEGFGSFEGVIKTKGELYDYLQENKGVIFINSDNEILTGLLKEQKTVAYGKSDHVEYRGEFLAADPFLRLAWSLKEKDETNIIETNLIGAYNLENILAAISVGSYFEVPATDINKAISGYNPTNNRSQLLKTENNTLLLDAYNANPTSMRAAIENFAIIEAENKVLILGDMFELGETSEIEHENIISLLKQKGFIDVYLVGKDFHKVARSFLYKVFPHVDELREELEKHKLENRFILIKGSRGVQLEGAVELL